ncbi:MAG: crossover junction endodeoxyribonuclease RuvC [Planctomycetota bacterium]
MIGGEGPPPSAPPRERCVLGVDPGLAKIGWGVIEVEGPRFRLVEYGSLRTDPETPHPQRLRAIYHELQRVIEEHRPEVMAVEEVFQGKGARSTLRAGEGRGACVLAGANAGLPVAEVAAAAVKLGVTGTGRATKDQVGAMVRRILGLEEVPKPADAADALAVALTYAQRRRTAIPR